MLHVSGFLNFISKASFLGLFVFWGPAKANLSCEIGSPTVPEFANAFKNPTPSTNGRLSLLETFHTKLSQDRVAHFLTDTRTNTRPSMVSGFCIDCLGTSPHQTTKDLRAVTQRALPRSISRSCIAASLRRQHTAPSRFCAAPEKAPKDLAPPGPNGPCITPEMTDYITWSFNQAVACLNPTAEPLDPFLLFQKFNNETGFKYFTGYAGGVGVGGLTSIAVQELNQSSRIMRQVSLYARPECEPFKNALLARPKNVHRHCEWIENDHGLARNLIYSVAYFLDIRDRQFANHRYDHQGQRISMRQKIQAVAGPDSLQWLNYASLALYGPSPDAALKSLNKVLNTNPRHFSEFKTRLVAEIPYLANLDKTTQQLNITDPRLTEPQIQCLGE